MVGKEETVVGYMISKGIELLVNNLILRHLGRRTDLTGLDWIGFGTDHLGVGPQWR